MIRLYSLHESSLAEPIVTTKPQEPHKVGTEFAHQYIHQGTSQTNQLISVWSGCTACMSHPLQDLYSYHKTPRITQGWNRVCSSVHSSRDESDKPVDFSVIRLYSLRESSLAGPIVTTKLQEPHKVGTELYDNGMNWDGLVPRLSCSEKEHTGMEMWLCLPLQQLWSHDH